MPSATMEMERESTVSRRSRGFLSTVSSRVRRASAPAVDRDAEDAERLRQLGYKQEFSRDLSLLKNFAISFGLLSMLTGLGGQYYYGFTHGGPAVIVWGWPLVVTMTLSVALPMAEICSSLPSSGGVYYWAGVMGGKNGPLYAWITGWFQLLGQVGITAGVEYTVVMYLQQVICIAKGRYYYLSKGATFGLYCAFTIFHGVLNCLSTNMLGMLSMVSMWWHLIGTLGVVIGLLAIAPEHQSGKFVFATFEKTEGVGINNPAYLFFVGLLMCQWAMCGYDTSAHVAEETRDAERAGPQGLIMAILGSFICGYMYLLSLTFSIQDPANIINPDTISGGFSVSQIFIDAFEARWGKPQGALAFMLILLGASQFCGTFCVTANSRMLYCFARDDGVPGAGWFKAVNPRNQLPVNAVIAMVTAALLLGTSLLGSTVAFSAMSSIGVIGLYISYGIPQLLRLTLARKTFKKGPFHLGILSIPIGWWGIFWCCFITVIFCLPSTYPVNSQTLNYAPVAVGIVIIFSMGWWIIDARKWFKGPVANVDLDQRTHSLAEAYFNGEIDDPSKTKPSDPEDPIVDADKNVGRSDSPVSTLSQGERFGPASNYDRNL